MFIPNRDNNHICSSSIRIADNYLAQTKTKTKHLNEDTPYLIEPIFSSYLGKLHENNFYC
jgi:hypothetical protein